MAQFEVKMNALDRFAMSVSPSWGAKRLQNRLSVAALSHTGYVVPGSPKKSMKGITATANSPDRDILPKESGMRALSRELYMSSPLAAAILRRHKTLSIGSGLQLQSLIDWEYLGMNQVEAEKSQKLFESEFDLWAESFNSDFDGINFYGDNQALGYFNLLLNGDFFFMPVWRPAPEKDFPYELCIKMIDADLVRNPYRAPNNADVKGGVEKDENGVVVAYYVWNCYPGEFNANGKEARWTRVPVFDEEGRQQLFHVFDPERISQRRGIPLLAGVAEPLKMLTRLADAELMSALVRSFFTVFIKDMSGMGTLMGPAMTPEEAVTGGGRYSPNEGEVGERNMEDGNDLEMGHGNIVYVDDQKDVTFADPGKTDKEFEGFWNSLATVVCAGGNIPIEQAMLKYETSYTAAKAAANDVWRYRQTARTLMNRRMNIPVYREFLTEAIVRNRLQAPGYFEDYGNMRAWSRCSWIGYGQGSLDPLREEKASAIALNNFTTTHEKEYARKHDGRWDAAMDTRAREEAYLESRALNNKPDPEELIGPDGQENEDETGQTN